MDIRKAVDRSIYAMTRAAVLMVDKGYTPEQIKASFLVLGGLVEKNALNSVEDGKRLDVMLDATLQSGGWKGFV